MPHKEDDLVSELQRERNRRRKTRSCCTLETTDCAARSTAAAESSSPAPGAAAPRRSRCLVIERSEDRLVTQRRVTVNRAEWMAAPRPPRLARVVRRSPRHTTTMRNRRTRSSSPCFLSLAHSSSNCVRCARRTSSHIPSFLRSFIPSFLHSFTPSLLHSFIPSFLHSVIPSFLHSFIPSFLHSFIPGTHAVAAVAKRGAGRRGEKQPTPSPAGQALGKNSPRRRRLGRRGEKQPTPSPAGRAWEKKAHADGDVAGAGGWGW